MIFGTKSSGVRIHWGNTIACKPSSPGCLIKDLIYQRERRIHLKRNIKRKYLVVAALAAGMTITMLSACTDTGTNSEGNTGEAVVQEAAESEESDTASKEQSQAADTAGTSAAAAPAILKEQYQPNPDYDKYAMVDYLVEDIGAEFTATVSKKADDSAYEVHCMLDNEEQIIVLDKDLAIISNKTGNLEYDAPLIVKKANDEDKWMDISKE